jgi:hypothetical protein
MKTDSSEDQYTDIKPANSFLDMKLPSIAILTVIVLAVDVLATVISSLVK